MDQSRGQQLVVGCLAAATAVAAGSTLAQGNAPGMRLVVGLAFTGVGLATCSLFSPELAGGFAVLVLTSTVFLYGQPLMDSVTALTAAPASAAGTPTPTNPGTNPNPPRSALA